MIDLNPFDSDSMTVQEERSPSELESSLFSQEPCQPLLRPKGEAPFQDSWEAEAYALGNLLVKLNHVTAKEWMDLLADSIQEAQRFGDPDTGETYYHHWCRSLEKFCFQAGLSSPSQYREILGLWSQAIKNTPHGVPLTLDNAFLPSEHQTHSHHPAGDEQPPSSQSIRSDFDGHVHSHARPETPPGNL
ncbi:MAG: hypothetical protein VKO39_09285 [Cyanobacteriota bacterium]|nr:hypothetical protein [Cyanobacteriota bacterium]